MTPVAKNRKPAPYKEKGSPKTRAVKFVVTEDEIEALEMLAKDWNCSVAQAVRTMIGMSEIFVKLRPILQTPQILKVLEKNEVEPSLLEWRIITLQRFHKYWSKVEPDVNNRK